MLSAGRIVGAHGDERWDTQFYEPGCKAGDVGIRAMASHPSGELICIGNFSHLAGGMAGTASIARWDGRGWSSVGSGLPGASLYAIVFMGNDLIVGGTFNSIAGQPITNLARWNGTNWSAIGGGVRGGRVQALAVQSNILYVGGAFTNAGNLRVNYIASWNGLQWDSLSGGMLATPGPTSPVQSLAAAQGYIYAGGRFNMAGGVESTNVARWNGVEWEPIGLMADNGTSGDVTTMAVDENGLLCVGGSFTRAGTNSAGLVATWDGTAWGTLGGGVSRSAGGGAVSCLVRHRNAWFVGGNFTRAGTNAANGLARWDGANWSSVSAPIATPVALAGHGADVLASGTLTGMMSPRVNGLVRINAVGQSTTIGNGIAGNVSFADRPYVKALSISAEGVQVGGYFNGQTPQVVGLWDGTNWAPLGNGLLGSFGVANPVHKIKSLATETYAAGRFAFADNSPGTGIGKLLANIWTNIGAGPRGHGLALEVSGEEILVGHAQGVSRWTGSAWTDLGLPLQGPVYALAFVGRDLYAGGRFTNSGSTALRNIARWDGTNWSSVGTGVNGTVRALAARDGALVLGGEFTEAGGLACARVARWMSGMWNSMGMGFSNGVNSSMAPNESGTAVYDLAFAPDGTLFAGGNFTASGSNAVKFVAAWNGTAWAPLGSGANHWVNALACDGRNLYAGGEFSMAGTNLSARFGRWELTGVLLTIQAFAAPAIPSGSNLTYTLRVKNVGEFESTNVGIEMPIPLGTAFIQASDAGVQVDDRVLWTLATLAPQQERILTATVNVAAASRRITLDDYRATLPGQSFAGSSVHTTILDSGLPPSIGVLEPANGSRFPTLSSVRVTFGATDRGHGVRQVDVFQNGVYVRSLVTPPYSLVLSNLRAGTYQVTAVVSDYALGTASTNVNFTVNRPVNDDFTNRTPLLGTSAYALGLNHDATVEAGEPPHDGFWNHNSVWWTWTAPADGRLTLDTAGSDFSHVLLLYRGNALTNLSALGGAKNNAGPNRALFSVDVLGGTNHQIVVDGGYPFTEGHIALRLAFDHAPVVSILAPSNRATFAGPITVPVSVHATDVEGTVPNLQLWADNFGIATNFGAAPSVFQVPNVAGGSFALTARATDSSGQQRTSAARTIIVPLVNDLFANRVRISGYRFVGFGTTVGAGFEAGEPGDDWPLDGPRKSVWWEWVAPISANVTLAADSEEYSAGIQAYSGTNISQLTRVASDINDYGHNQITFAATAGSAYQISIDGFHFAAGTAAGKYRLSGEVQGLGTLRMTVAHPTGGLLPVQIDGPTGASFRIESSTNLMNWIQFATNVLAGTSTNLQVPVEGLEKQFYRVLLQQ